MNPTPEGYQTLVSYLEEMKYEASVEAVMK